MAIWIVLTDDWELRGNGAGRVEDLQQKPAERLMDLYDRFGVKATFNLEVIQQLAFERHAGTDPQIASGRDAWLATVRSMLSRGFDVQLHIHPQWMGADRIDGWWKLDRRWHIADYASAEIERMIDSALAYLKPVVPAGQIVSFRGGAWGMGPPSRPVLNALTERGIKIDVSIVNGVYYEGESITLDYRKLHSPNRPYRPDIDDIRRVASSLDQASQVTEIPTQSISRLAMTLFILGRLSPSRLRYSWRCLKDIVLSGVRGKAPGKNPNIPSFVIRDPFGFISGRARSPLIFDLSSRFSPELFIEMADLCIARARKQDGKIKLLVLENHTKDLQRDADFGRIETLIRHIRTAHPDIEFKTLSDVAKHAGEIL